MPYAISFSRLAWALELIVGHQDLNAIDGSIDHAKIEGLPHGSRKN